MSRPTYPSENSQMAHAREERQQRIEQICRQRSLQMDADFRHRSWLGPYGPERMTADQGSALSNQRKASKENCRLHDTYLEGRPTVAIAEGALLNAPFDSQRPISPLDLSSDCAPVSVTSTRSVQHSANADKKEESSTTDNIDRTVAPSPEAIGTGSKACSASLSMGLFDEAIDLGYDCLMEAEDRFPDGENVDFTTLKSKAQRKKTAADGYSWIFSFAK